MRDLPNIITAVDVAAHRERQESAAAPALESVPDAYAEFAIKSDNPTHIILIDPGTYTTSGVGLDRDGVVTRFYKYDLSAVVEIDGVPYFGSEAVSKEWNLPKDTKIIYPFNNGVIREDGTGNLLLGHVFDELKHKPARLRRSKTKEVIFSVPSGDHTALSQKEMREFASNRGVKARFMKQADAALEGSGIMKGGKSVMGIELGGGTIIVTIEDERGDVIAEKVICDFGGTTINDEIAEAMRIEQLFVRTPTIEAMKRLVASGEVSNAVDAPYLEPGEEGKQKITFMGRPRMGLRAQPNSLPVSIIETPIERNAVKVGVAVHDVIHELLGQAHLQDHLESIVGRGNVILTGGVSKTRAVQREIFKQLDTHPPVLPHPETPVLIGMMKKARRYLLTQK